MRGLFFLLFVLTFFVISCRTVKDTSQVWQSVVDTNISRISYSDSLHQELKKQILSIEFDSLKVTIPEPDEKPTVTATIYGGRLDSHKENAVVDTSCKEATDNLESHIDTNETVIKEVEQVSIGKPPKMFIIYLIIVGAILLFLYFKFK